MSAPSLEKEEEAIDGVGINVALHVVPRKWAEEHGLAEA